MRATSMFFFADIDVCLCFTVCVRMYLHVSNMFAGSLSLLYLSVFVFSVGCLDLMLIKASPSAFVHLTFPH